MYNVETSEFRISSKETDTTNNLFCCLKLCIAYTSSSYLLFFLKILSSTQYIFNIAKL